MYFPRQLRFSAMAFAAASLASSLLAYSDTETVTDRLRWTIAFTREGLWFVKGKYFTRIALCDMLPFYLVMGEWA